MLPTQYESFRYANQQHFRYKVPPNDLALVRMLMKFDGHFLRQGLKFCTTTHYRHFNHMMDAKEIDWWKGYETRIPNLTLDEFRNMMFYKTMTDWTPETPKEW